MSYEFFYLILICILFILAISDLIVGVSNDAVNFLSSAYGSKSAPLYVILIITTIGIILGATFSSGMMEVARSGVFNPSMFSFEEIMCIFLAVVVTDVILLDLFNTIGLPTSTTVSMIFELLGASVILSLIKIFSSDSNIGELSQYINTSKASAIVFSILASVFIGFIVGFIVQFIARLIFSFKIKRTVKYFGSVWGGICISLITYFVIFKGMKDSTLIPSEVFATLQQHQVLLLLSTFGISTVILQLVFWIFKYNPLRVVVLAGTFALAMAFAGNDLVNFIGVSMAGLSSFEIFQAGGCDPTITMGALKGQTVPTDIIFLFLSGVVMATTLWFSKKSRNVLKTTVNLSSKNSEDEKFSATPLSRAMVKMGIGINEGVNKILPSALKRHIEKRFRPVRGKDDEVAFDLVRASVNLMVASALIVFGTSLRLPLSTTYITFMVAMGTSLSDRAWGRENAVYRITGVFTVIGGWFITAIVAFCIAAVIVSIIYFGGIFAIVTILAVVIFLMVLNRTKHKKQEQQKANHTQYLDEATSKEELNTDFNNDIIVFIEKIPKIQLEVIQALDEDNLRLLKNTQKDYSGLNDKITEIKAKLNTAISWMEKENFHGAPYFLQEVNYLGEILHFLSYIIDNSYEHIDNRHKPLMKDQISDLTEANVLLTEMFQHLVFIIKNNAYTQLEELRIEQQKLSVFYESIDKRQMKRIKNGISGTKSSNLFLRITSNSKNMGLFAYMLGKASLFFNSVSEESARNTINNNIEEAETN